MITLPIAAALAASILGTSFLSGIFGMAGGMILMGILLAMMPLAAAMVLHGSRRWRRTAGAPGCGARIFNGGLWPGMRQAE
jgi:hypothetical protein